MIDQRCYADFRLTFREVNGGWCEAQISAADDPTDMMVLASVQTCLIKYDPELMQAYVDFISRVVSAAITNAAAKGQIVDWEMLRVQ